MIIQLYRNFSNISVEGNEICASSGALLSQIAAAARNASLTGFEFAGGIPGTLGGAVFMMAGAYGGELKDVLKEAVVMTEQGEILTLPVENCWTWDTEPAGSKKLVIWFWRQDLF